MRRLLGLGLGAAMIALVAGLPPARAETPKDGLVMADFIDDMISLDPGRGVRVLRPPRPRRRSTTGW